MGRVPLHILHYYSIIFIDKILFVKHDTLHILAVEMHIDITILLKPKNTSIHERLIMHNYETYPVFKISSMCISIYYHHYCFIHNFSPLIW